MVKPFLSENVCFFQLPSGIKVQLADKMMQSNRLCVLLHVKRKKLLILNIFIWFLIRHKIQDGDHVWWRHRPAAVPPPIKHTSSCREDQRLSTEGKIVLKYCNKKKNQGGPSTNLLYHGRGMTFCVRPRVNWACRRLAQLIKYLRFFLRGQIWSNSWWGCAFLFFNSWS